MTQNEYSYPLTRKERLQIISKTYKPFMYDYSRLPEDKRPKKYYPKSGMTLGKKVNTYSSQTNSTI